MAKTNGWRNVNFILWERRLRRDPFRQFWLAVIYHPNILPKLSDLNATIAASGGHKARPYKRLDDPLGRGGLIPARKQSTVALVPL